MNLDKSYLLINHCRNLLKDNAILLVNIKIKIQIFDFNTKNPVQYSTSQLKKVQNLPEEEG